MLIRCKLSYWLSALTLGFCFVGLGPEKEAAAQQPVGTLPPIRRQQNPQVPRNNPTAQPSAIQPRATQPNATQPNTSQPGTLPPRSNQPGVNAPRTNPVNGVQPRTAQPRTMPAGATRPGTQQPVSRPPVAAYRPLAPFQLSPAEKAFRDQVLVMWEKEGEKVSTYKVEFERLRYLKAFAVPGRDAPNIKEKGTLAYSKPDKGSFKVKEICRLKIRKAADGKPLDSWPISKDTTGKKEVGENWVCDGKNVYSFNTKAKHLEVSQIPKEMQGKSIVDGPLPFLFGAKAETLKKRYWIRVTKADQKEIWIDSYPKYINDARNYKHVELVLDRKTLLPTAMQVHEPNGDRKVYMFGQATVNSTFDRLFNPFRAPSTPLGWKRVIIPVPNPQAPGNPTGPTARRQPPVRTPLQPRVNQPGTRQPVQPANRNATAPTRRPRF